MGDYGAFAFVEALASFPAGDDGAAILAALTKCDSWYVGSCTQGSDIP